MEIVQLYASPSIWLVKDFVKYHECAHLIALASGKMQRSLTVDSTTDKFIEVDSRTSFFACLSLQVDHIVATIEERIANIVQLPVENGEGFQVIRYGIGEEYKAHYDYFDVTQIGGLKAIEKGGQRLATMLLYLTDVEAGGETWFPKISLKVSPLIGNALLFYNVYANGQPDVNSFHASLPVVRGEKLVATKWIREKAHS